MIDFATMFVSQVGAIVLALIGMGAFAIVVARLAGLFVQVVLYFAVTRWRPSISIDKSALKDVWRYARNVLGFNVVNFWSRNLDSVIIARSAGTTVLGYYSRAYSIMLLPVSLVAGAIGRVLLPTIARQQHNLPLAMATWTRYTILSLFVGLPIVCLFVAGPEQVVLVLLGPQWGDSAIFLQILGISIAPQLIIRPLGFVFQALGRTRAQLVIGIATTGITAALMFLGNVFAGPLGVAIGFTVAYSLHLVLYLIYARTRLHLQIGLLIWPSLRLLLVAAFATGTGTGVRFVTDEWPEIAQLVLIACAIAAAYLAAAYVVARGSFTAALDVVRGSDLLDT